MQGDILQDFQAGHGERHFQTNTDRNLCLDSWPLCFHLGHEIREDLWDTAASCRHYSIHFLALSGISPRNIKCCCMKYLTVSCTCMHQESVYFISIFLASHTLHLLLLSRENGHTIKLPLCYDGILKEKGSQSGWFFMFPAAQQGISTHTHTLSFKCDCRNATTST